MAVETSGKDARFAINDPVQQTLTDESGNVTVNTGIVIAALYGTAQQVSLTWKGSLARNAGELSPRFFYKVRGQGFNARRAYREETLEPLVE